MAQKRHEELHRDRGGWKCGTDARTNQGNDRGNRVSPDEHGRRPMDQECLHCNAFCDHLQQNQYANETVDDAGDVQKLVRNQIGPT